MNKISIALPIVIASNSEKLRISILENQRDIISLASSNGCFAASPFSTKLQTDFCEAATTAIREATQRVKETNTLVPPKDGEPLTLVDPAVEAAALAERERRALPKGQLMQYSWLTAASAPLWKSFRSDVSSPAVDEPASENVDSSDASSTSIANDEESVSATASVNPATEEAAVAEPERAAEPKGKWAFLTGAAAPLVKRFTSFFTPSWNNSAVDEPESENEDSTDAASSSNLFAVPSGLKGSASKLLRSDFSWHSKMAAGDEDAEGSNDSSPVTPRVDPELQAAIEQAAAEVAELTKKKRNLAKQVREEKAKWFNNHATDAARASLKKVEADKRHAEEKLAFLKSKQ